MTITLTDTLCSVACIVQWKRSNGKSRIFIFRDEYSLKLPTLLRILWCSQYELATYGSDVFVSICFVEFEVV